MCDVSIHNGQYENDLFQWDIRNRKEYLVLRLRKAYLILCQTRQEVSIEFRGMP